MPAKKATLRVDLRLPRALSAEVDELAKLAGVSPTSVLKIATAHSLRLMARTPTPAQQAANTSTHGARYVVQADDTVLDTSTELTWARTLTQDGEAARMTHAAAEKACAALGDGWRLPTRAELLTLVDDTKHDPAIDNATFPDTRSSWYWTSTPAAWNPSAYAWIVVFNYGAASNYHRLDGAFVRAVRSPGQ